MVEQNSPVIMCNLPLDFFLSSFFFFLSYYKALHNWQSSLQVQGTWRIWQTSCRLRALAAAQTQTGQAAGTGPNLSAEPKATSQPPTPATEAANQGSYTYHTCGHVFHDVYFTFCLYCDLILSPSVQPATIHPPWTVLSHPSPSLHTHDQSSRAHHPHQSPSAPAH